MNMNEDFEDILVKKAYSGVKAPPSPVFAEETQTEKKSFWSGIWDKISGTRDAVTQGLRELSDDALDGVCAAGDRKTPGNDEPREDKDLSGR